MIVCEFCGEETFLAHLGKDVGYNLDEHGKKWMAIMCGETNEEYITRWYKTTEKSHPVGWPEERA